MKNSKWGSRSHDILKKFMDFDLTSSYSISAFSWTERYQFNVLRTNRSSEQFYQRIKEFINWKQRNQKNTFGHFEVGTFWNMHCASSVMHLWNAKKELRPIRSQEIYDIIKKAGPKTTLGPIRKTQVSVSQWNQCNFLNTLFWQLNTCEFMIIMALFVYKEGRAS